MSLSPAFLDELRARVSLHDVIGRHVQWDRRKSNPRKQDWWACCPFHGEKTPSFHVDERKGFYHCFGCGVKGDAITFLIEKQGMGFREAVEQLAAEAGLEVPAESPRQREAERQKAGLAEIMEMAAAFYEGQLRTASASHARTYLSEGRGLTDATVARFRLGFGPGTRTALTQHLQAKGVEVAQLVEAGLSIVPEGGGNPFDRFRDRIMFPILDARGRVIAFGGRAMRSDAQAKYLNSPDTPLFHKGRVLYNFNTARAAAADAGTVLVVEGYMDVIALAQAGIDHAVAPLGTALTEDQMRLLWRAAAEPVLCLDGDAAGLRAASRALDRALPLLEPGRSFRFAFLPGGQDPDDLIRAEGRAAMESVIAAARPLVDVLWERERDLSPLDTPERRADLAKRLDQAAGQIADTSVRGFYQSDLRARLDSLFRPQRQGDGPPRGKGAGAGWGQGGRGGGPGRSRPGGMRGPGGYRRQGTGPATLWPDASPSLRASRLALSGANPDAPREVLILATLLDHPQLVEPLADDLAALDLSVPDHGALRDALLSVALEASSASDGHRGLQESAGEGGGDLDAPGLLRHLTRLGVAGLAERVSAAGHALGARRSGPVDLDGAERTVRRTIARHKQAQMLRADLREAEARLAEDMSDQNFARLTALQAQIRAMEIEDAGRT
ncbi:DNA primase [Futiania mangrovi]|uniref:DNA primase n=1 Tax=Futiania mangrovi TaxID=2959716 RepID=A0A9J6PMV1_9PROT|nr:DNA primase [Futiania mangrovii]MCP1337394.1 DNA primase [Futiania mangrovii]